jgi:4-hydroxybenzoate polyprenyltransferase
MKTLFYILLSLRPKGWIKNLFVFIPLVFVGLFNLQFFLKTVEAFFLFSLSTGAVYLLNDVLDKDKDKQHPEKSKRPIASEKLNSGLALFVSLILIILTLWLGLLINLKFATFLMLYIVLNTVYSLWLEEVRFINSICAGLGYVLRIYAGGAVINLILNIWYFIFGFLFGSFHSFYKKKKDSQ